MPTSSFRGPSIWVRTRQGLQCLPEKSPPLPSARTSSLELRRHKIQTPHILGLEMTVSYKEH